MYIGIVTSMVSLFKLLDHFDIEYSYLTIFYACYGLALLYIAGKDKGKYEWSTDVVYNAAHGLLALSAITLVLQTLASLNLSDDQIIPYFVSLVIMTSIFSWASVMLKDETLKGIYKNCAFLLSGVAYLSAGTWLGFSFLIQTEFYSLPLAIFLLWNGLALAACFVCYLHYYT
ncbi:MAG: hypothetical protein FD167_3610 [bacterium]|nr:MAG: hypothetical protein FD167_3610 [bacterium]